MKKTDYLVKEDFAYFRNGISSGRLNPVRVGKLLFVFPLVSLVFVYIGEQLAIYNVSDGFYENWKLLIQSQWIFLEINGILSLLFLSRRLSIKFQKIQMLVLIFNSLGLAFNMPFFFLIAAKSENLSFPFTGILVLYVMLSLLLFLGSLLRAVFLLKQGAFRKEGPGLFGKQYSESLSGFSTIAVVTFVVVFIGSMILTLFQHLGVSVILVPVSVLISLLISSAGVTEFIFVLYCKIRFPSFNVSMKDQKLIDKEDGEIDDLIVQIEKENRQEFKKLKRERKQERKKRKRNRRWDAK